jgi:hypothetical protein
MIENVICYTCFFTWFLLWVILVIAMYYFGLHYLNGGDESSSQTKGLEETTQRIMDAPIEKLIDRIMKQEGHKIDVELKEKEGIKDFMPLDPDAYVLEVARRLIIQFRNFNTATKIFSIALIVLAVVQIILLIFS